MAVFRALHMSTVASFKNYWVTTGPLMWGLVTLPRFIFQGLFFVLMASFAGGSTTRTYAIIGNAFSFAIVASVVHFTQVLEWEKVRGTWPLIIASPSPVWLAIIGLSTAYLVEALAGGMVTFLVLTLGAGLFFPPGALVVSLLPFLLMLVSAGSFGWLLGAITLSVRSGLLVANIIGYALLVLCGVNFPIDILPFPLSVIAHGLPITNGLLAIRGLLEGKTFVDVLPLLLLEVSVGAAYAFVAQSLFRRRLASARQTGQLEIF